MLLKLKSIIIELFIENNQNFELFYLLDIESKIPALNWLKPVKGSITWTMADIASTIATQVSTYSGAIRGLNYVCSSMVKGWPELRTSNTRIFNPFIIEL